MCYSPLKIYNNTLHFSALHDRVIQTIPCGKCGECLSRKQSDYFVRSYYEYLDNKACHGIGLFFTLTYSPQFLPMIVERSTGQTFPCFNKKDVQYFVDALKKRINRKYGLGRFRYLLTSEYGSMYQRPHYHCLVFINDANADPRLVNKMIREIWRYGSTYFGDNYGLLNSLAGLHYVCKYISKDINYVKDTESLNTSPLYITEESRKYIINNLNPFHLQSKGYGYSMLRYVKLEQLMKGYVNILHGKSFKRFKVPLYIDRILFYSTDNSLGSYRLTPLGFKMKSIRYDDNFEYICQYVDKVTLDPSKWLSDDSLITINSILNAQYQIADITSMCMYYRTMYSSSDFVHYLLEQRDYTSLVDDDLLPGQLRNFRYVPKENKDFDFAYNYADFAYNEDTRQHVANNMLNDFNIELENYARLFDAMRLTYGKYRNNNFFQKYQQRQRVNVIKDYYGFKSHP